MTVNSPLSQQYVFEVLDKNFSESTIKVSALCSSLIRQMREAGRDKKDAKRIVRAVYRQVRDKHEGKNRWKDGHF